jgi:hypothetical protein
MAIKIKAGCTVSSLSLSRREKQPYNYSEVPPHIQGKHIARRPFSLWRCIRMRGCARAGAVGLLSLPPTPHTRVVRRSLISEGSYDYHNDDARGARQSNIP